MLRCSLAGKPGQAIITLTRRHFDKSDLQKVLEGVRFEEKQFRNDIYSKVRPPPLRARPAFCRTSENAHAPPPTKWGQMLMF